jgi:hypothetical protein
MASAYDLMRQRCGLSQAEAAEYHEVRLDTVKSWCSHRRPAPPKAVDELRDLYDKITAGGIAYAEEVKRGGLQRNEAGDGVYRVGVPVQDSDARAAHWPALGPCMAAVAVAIAALPRGGGVELVPRPGSRQIPRGKPPPKPGPSPDDQRWPEIGKDDDSSML